MTALSHYNKQKNKQVRRKLVLIGEKKLKNYHEQKFRNRIN